VFAIAANRVPCMFVDPTIEAYETVALAGDWWDTSAPTITVCVPLIGCSMLGRVFEESPNFAQIFIHMLEQC
jgi:hypothetical protein